MTMVADVPKITTSEMEARLKRCFSNPEHQIVFGVRNDAGFKADRTADAIAMGLWQSTGNHLHGFEIKVSRSDWLRELKDPWKSESIAKYCDKWSLVIARADIVKPDELPKGWGVYVPYGQTLKCTVRPELRTPEPMPRGFLAALIRRMSEAPEATVLQAAVEAARVEGHAVGKAEGTGGNAERELLALQTTLKRFEEASGVDIDRWNGESIGRAVKFVIDNRWDLRNVLEVSERLSELKSKFDDLAGNLDAFMLPESRPGKKAT